jgi:hypothetical protein
MNKPTQAQLDAGFAVMRQKANESGYGHFVSDDKLRALAGDVAAAILNAAPKSPAQ